jgi:hypothetical protein
VELLFVFAVVAIVVLVLITRNANLLFVAKVKNGQICYVRGRAPKKLLADMGEVVRRRPVQAASLRVTVLDGMASLASRGDLDDQERQRLRNILGMWPVAKIRSASYVSGKVVSR